MTEPTLIRSALLDSVPGIVHGFSTRGGGASGGPFDSLNLGGFGTDDTETVRENRRRFAAALGRPLEALSMGEQRHGNAVARADRPGFQSEAGGNHYRGVDALVTKERGALLTVLSADCVPILIAADDGSAVAAVHAGWRGTAAGVLTNAVAALCRRYDLRPKRLVVALGPAIGPCCYEVDGPVIDAFGVDNPALAPGRPDHAMLDLRAANVAQLEALGVATERIEVLDEYCTAHQPEMFFSHRREGEPTGRFAGGIAIRD